MADSYQYIEDTGLIVSDTSDVLTTVQTEWQTAFGADMPVTADTPQGVAITAETTARVAVINNNTAVANQINPNQAGGIFLEAVCAFLDITRDPATYTTVDSVPVTGVAKTVIPAGSQAKTTAGDIFETVSIVTLDTSGNGTADFQAVDSGAVPCADGDLINIVTGVIGWETVNNTGIEATLGADAMTDAALRTYRNQTLAKLSTGMVSGIVARLLDTTQGNVTSLQFLENIGSDTETIDGIVLAPHSIWACCQGGTDADIAMALLEGKDGGCAWNGAVTVPVVEPASGQTYNVQFDRPTAVPIVVRVTMRQGSSTAVLPTTVPIAVTDYASGAISNDPGFTVGEQVSPFDIAGAIATENPGAFVSKVEVSLASAIVWQTTELAIAKNQIATVTASSVTVLVIT